MYNNIVMFMLKSVNINSYKELNRFYSRLRLYKILYYKDSFCLNKISNISDYDKLELNCVIEAFNIKDKKSRISYVYDSACNYIDKKYVNENICEFKNDRCLYQRYSNNKFNMNYLRKTTDKDDKYEPKKYIKKLDLIDNEIIFPKYIQQKGKQGAQHGIGPQRRGGVAERDRADGDDGETGLWLAVVGHGSLRWEFIIHNS